MQNREQLRQIWNLFQALKKNKAHITIIQLRKRLQALSITWTRRQTERIAMHFGADRRANHLHF